MKQHLMPILYTVIGVILGLIVYNMFIVGHFGMFESSQNNYDVTDDGRVIDINTGLPVAA